MHQVIIVGAGPGGTYLAYLCPILNNTGNRLYLSLCSYFFSFNISHYESTFQHVLPIHLRQNTVKQKHQKSSIAGLFHFTQRLSYIMVSEVLNI
ncbi:MAG TPA: hypothetical protein DD791_04760 [Syntrophomonas sp.]|jgi:hypothetical protein|nr:hypothetical protein [Syntrophomonas sp.]